MTTQKNVGDRSNITLAILKLVEVAKPLILFSLPLQTWQPRVDICKQNLQSNQYCTQSSANPAKHCLLRLFSPASLLQRAPGLQQPEHLQCSSSPLLLPSTTCPLKRVRGCLPLPIPGPYPEGWGAVWCACHRPTLKTLLVLLLPHIPWWRWELTFAGPDLASSPHTSPSRWYMQELN